MERHNQMLNPETQLSNIRNMIRLTSENLSKLNERFAGFKYPPKIYIQEYDQLTTKLNEFQDQEHKIIEQLVLLHASYHSHNHHSHNHHSHNHLHASDLQYSPSDHQTNEFNFDPFSRSRVNDFTNLNDLNSNTDHHNNNSNNTPPTPKSPFKSIVRVYLPNFQSTIVQVSNCSS